METAPKLEQIALGSHDDRHCERQGVERRPSFRTGYGEAIQGNVEHLAAPGSPRPPGPRPGGPRDDDSNNAQPALASTLPSEASFDPDGDRLREECGVFGIFNHPDAAAIVALGLHALQHRGQEAAGIVAFDGARFHSERRQGLVGDHFSKAATIDRLPGRTAIGHVRYSTTGETVLRNVQPLFAELEAGRPRGRA